MLREVRAHIGLDKRTFDDVLALIQHRLRLCGVDGFTAFAAQGAWEGQRENTIIILVAVKEDLLTPVQSALMLAAKDAQQEAIYLVVGHQSSVVTVR